MRRKSVRLFLKGIGELRATLEAQCARIGRRLAARLAAPPRAAQAYPPVLEHLETELAALEAGLAAAEDAYGTVKQQLAELRSRRDCAARKLSGMHAPLQRLIADFPGFRSDAVGRRTPAAPRLLFDQAAGTVDFLRQLERDPAPPILGVSLDPAAAATELEAARARLGLLLDELEATDARAAAAREDADAAISHAESVAPWVTQAIEGLAGLAQVASVGGQLGKRG